MQRLLLPILALLALPASALLAQNITGTWQGTLKVNGTNGSVDLRTVMKISRADNDSLKGVFYSIDQDPTPVAMTSITLKGAALKISLVQMNGAFDGTPSGDGNVYPPKATDSVPTRCSPHLCRRNGLPRISSIPCWQIPLQRRRWRKIGEWS